MKKGDIPEKKTENDPKKWGGGKCCEKCFSVMTIKVIPRTSTQTFRTKY